MSLPNHQPNLWIINDYAGSPKHGMEFRHYYLSQYWKKNYNVTIISGNYSHLYNYPPKKRKEYIDEITYKWISVLKYSNSKDKKRVINWFLFSLKLMFLPFSKTPKPNIILLSSLTPFTVIPALCLSVLYKAPLIFEIKDIWPLTLTEIGGYSTTHPFIKIMRWCELIALKKSNYIVSNLPNYKSYLNELNIHKPFKWICNGCSLPDKKNKPNNPQLEHLEQSIPKNKIIIGYAGSIGVANNMKPFFEAVKQLSPDSKYYFVVVGKGEDKAMLKEKYAHLNNLLFLNPVEKDNIPHLLSLFDICYLGFLDKNLYTYGVAANKIFDYMLSGKPIIMGLNSKQNIVDIANCGVTIQPNDSNAIVKAIQYLGSLNKHALNTLGKNGMQYATKHFSYKTLSQLYISVFNQLID